MEVKLPFLRLVRRERVKIALSIRELVQETSEFSVKKAVNCKAQFYFADPKRLLLVYRVRCGESYSSKQGHKVRVLFDTSRVTKDSTIDSLDVRVSCTCPAFLYWGAQWNLYTRDSLEGPARPKLQAPQMPGKSDFVICKHIKVVSDRIGPYLVRLLQKLVPEDSPTKEEVNKLQTLFEGPKKDEKKSPSKPSGPKKPEEKPATKPQSPKKETEKTPSDEKGKKSPSNTPVKKNEKEEKVPPQSTKQSPKGVEPVKEKPKPGEPAPTKKELDELQRLFQGEKEKKPKEVSRKKPKPEGNLDVKQKSRGVLD